MTDRLDQLERSQLFLGTEALVFEAVQVAIDELDRLEDAAWGLALPDFAEASLAQRLEQPIAANRFEVGSFRHRHDGGTRMGSGRRRTRLPTANHANW